MIHQRHTTQTSETASRPLAHFPGKYLSLMSRRSDGTEVATPVWFVEEDGRLLVLTDADSYKVKRIRRDPSVRIAVCSASGRLKTEPVAAHAELLPESHTERVRQLMARKYRLDRIFILPVFRAIQRLRHPHHRAGAPAVLAIAPAPGSGDHRQGR